MKYEKLVRDKIPEIIKKKTNRVESHTANEKEYREKLKAKLLEEVNEFLTSEKKEELADILEVIYAICEEKNINREEIEKIRINKLKERGGFTKKIILDEAE